MSSFSISVGDPVGSWLECSDLCAKVILVLHTKRSHGARGCQSNRNGVVGVIKRNFEVQHGTSSFVRNHQSIWGLHVLLLPCGLVAFLGFGPDTDIGGPLVVSYAFQGLARELQGKFRAVLHLYLDVMYELGELWMGWTNFPLTLIWRVVAPGGPHDNGFP